MQLIAITMRVIIVTCTAQPIILDNHCELAQSHAGCNHCTWQIPQMYTSKTMVQSLLVPQQ